MMPSEEMKATLAGDEVVDITGWAIAYKAMVRAPSGGHYAVGTITLGPKMIQVDDIPKELHAPILALIDAHERRRWGLPLALIAKPKGE